MSDDGDDKVGYKEPPRKSRWVKGCPSPNPKGRPKRHKTPPLERSLSWRQFQEDVISLMDKDRETRTPSGDVKIMTAVQILLQKQLERAVSHDNVSGRHLLKLFADALTYEERQQARTLSTVIREELEEKHNQGIIMPDEFRHLSNLRRRTRRYK